MAEKVTVMVLKVDLQCASCYKKVKKVLCKFPQIRNQEYDEKANTVRITVVCCSPEKIRDKLCYRGAKAIKSIEIKPPKPKEPEKPKEADKPKAVEKPKETEKPKAVEKPKEAEKLVQGFSHMPMYPAEICCGPYSQGYHGYGRPVPPSQGPYYDGYGYEYGNDYRANKNSFSSDCFSEENPQGCTIM